MPTFRKASLEVVVPFNLKTQKSHEKHVLNSASCSQCRQKQNSALFSNPVYSIHPSPECGSACTNLSLTWAQASPAIASRYCCCCKTFLSLCNGLSREVPPCPLQYRSCRQRNFYPTRFGFVFPRSNICIFQRECD